MYIFKPTYLYIKTHNITGLKYFGKTTQSDPFRYSGSGKYWKRHLKIHGEDVSTEILGHFSDKNECEEVALNFSEENDIVHSTTWANFIPENGLDGGDAYFGRTWREVASSEDAYFSRIEKLKEMNLRRNTPEFNSFLGERIKQTQWSGEIGDKRRAKLSSTMKEKNPSIKTFKIIYVDGSEEVITGIFKWLDENGITYETFRYSFLNKGKIVRKSVKDTSFSKNPFKVKFLGCEFKEI